MKRDVKTILLKKLARLDLVPTLMLSAIFGIFLFIALSCEPDPGEKCSSCSSDSECDGSMQCFSFSDGKSRCADSAGDKCSKL